MTSSGCCCCCWWWWCSSADILYWHCTTRSRLYTAAKWSIQLGYIQWLTINTKTRYLFYSYDNVVKCTIILVIPSQLNFEMNCWKTRIKFTTLLTILPHYLEKIKCSTVQLYSTVKVKDGLAAVNVYQVADRSVSVSITLSDLERRDERSQIFPVDLRN